MLLWIVQLGYKSGGSPAPTPTPSPAGPLPSGGGGGIDYQRIKRDHRRPNRELKSLLDESLPAVYAELQAAAAPVAAQARAIVAPFNDANRVDWVALDADAKAVGRLLALVGHQRTQMRRAAEAAAHAALQRSDEDWFLMN